MAAPTITIYESFREYLGDGTFDLNSNPFKAALLTSAYTPAQATDDVWADMSANEVANGNGYTTGGVTLTTVVWTRTGATLKFDADDVAWTASGAGITARYLVIRASGTLNGRVDPVVAYVLLDSAPADVVVAAGNSLTVQWNASGILTLT